MTIFLPKMAMMKISASFPLLYGMDTPGDVAYAPYLRQSTKLIKLWLCVGQPQTAELTTELHSVDIETKSTRQRREATRTKLQEVMR